MKIIIGCTMMSDVTFVIVLNYNNTKLTKQCIETCLVMVGNNTIVLVDNNSKDKSFREIKNQHQQIILIENAKNLGYAGGNNVGIKYALEHGAEYVLILNNDTIVPPDLVAVLSEELKKDDKIAAISPLIYYENGKDIWYAGANIDRNNARIFHYEAINNFNNGFRDTDFPSGCAVMFPAKILKHVGLFDETFFLLYEDVDWGLRARTKGLVCMVTDKASIKHLVSSTTNYMSGLYKYYLCRNTFILIGRYKGHFVYNVFKVSINYWLNEIKKMLLNKKLRSAIYVFKGLTEGVFRAYFIFSSNA